MLIRRLELRNIRSYEELALDFDEGITLLSGDIGAGKSTVLQAIEFALFGTQRAALDGESLLRHGSDEGSVHLTFSLGTREFVIERTLKRGSAGVRQTECSLSIDGSTESLSAQELKARVLELLGYPDALLTKSKGLIFRHTVYTPQEEMKQIIFLPIEERLNTLRTLFGIERYKLVKENAQLVLRELRARERTEAAHALAVPQLERELEVATQAASGASALAAETEVALASATKSLHESRTALAQTRGAYEAQLRIEQERAALTYRLRELDRSQRNAQEDLARVEEYLSLPLVPVTDCNNEIDETRRRQLLAEKDLQLTLARIAEFGAKRTIHSDQARSITTLATCPVCRQPVTEAHKHAVQTQTDSAVREFDTELARLRAREIDLRSQYQAATQQFTQLNEQQRRFSVYQRELLQRGDQERTRERLIERRTVMRAESLAASEKLALIVPADPAVQERYRATETLVAARETAREAAQRRVLDAQSVASGAQMQAAVLRERLSHALVARQAVESLQHQRQWLEEHFLDAVAIIERHVLASLHAEFGEFFTAFFAKLVEDETITVGLGESFEPVITQNGYDAALEQLSGGEKTAVALSYRLGLYKVVSDFVSTIQTKELLILDEPTDGFSSEQLDRVRDVLRALGCRQIILVSHEPRMENACDHVVRIAKRLHRSAATAA